MTTPSIEAELEDMRRRLKEAEEQVDRLNHKRGLGQLEHLKALALLQQAERERDEARELLRRWRRWFNSRDGIIGPTLDATDDLLDAIPKEGE